MMFLADIGKTFYELSSSGRICLIHVFPQLPDQILQEVAEVS